MKTIPKYPHEAAFPRPPYVGPSASLPEQWGLTKREYFAAIALQGILARVVIDSDVEDRAAMAVVYADKLLAKLLATGG